MFVVLGYLVRRPASCTLHRPIIELFLHRNVWAKGVGWGLTCTPDVFIPHVHAFHAYAKVVYRAFRSSGGVVTPHAPQKNEDNKNSSHKLKRLCLKSLFNPSFSDW